MKQKPFRQLTPGFRRDVAESGLALIEMMGVMAIILIVTLILVPALIRKLDRVAKEKEDAVLFEMSESFRTLIRRTKTIPDASGYGAALAEEMGLHSVEVLENPKGRGRLLMIDPDLRVGINANQVLPFTQTISGSIEPISPRLMIMSTLGDAFPSGITNGVASSTNVFNELWALSDGSIPNSWSNWNRGRGDDLRIQRLHLADLFVPMILNNDENTLGQYSIDSMATNTMPASSPRMVNAYFLVDTMLGLHDVSGNLEAYEALYQPSSFFFEMGIWRARFQGVDAGYPGGFNLQVVADMFLNAPWNANAKSVNDPATQAKVITAMENFMNAYLDWANDGFPSHPSNRQAIEDAQNALETYSVNLLFKP
jgi:hypothetical protein